MLTVEHPYYGRQTIDIDNYIPPTKRELIYDELGDKQWLKIPMLHRGIEIKLSTTYLIIYRLLNIPKNLFIPNIPTYQFKKHRKIIVSKKVPYILLRNKEIDVIATNKLLIDEYNNLTKEVMIKAREYKIIHLNKDIEFLNK